MAGAAQVCVPSLKASAVSIAHDVEAALGALRPPTACMQYSLLQLKASLGSCNLAVHDCS